MTRFVSIALLLIASSFSLDSAITATLTVTNGQSTSTAHGVTLGLVASSSAGSLATEIWDCGNGDARSGGHPALGSLAFPASVPLSGTLPDAVICYYRTAGTYTPTVRIVDTKGNMVLVSAIATVLP